MLVALMAEICQTNPGVGRGKIRGVKKFFGQKVLRYKIFSYLSRCIDYL